MEESLVAVGKIVKAHGLKGEVNVFPLTDFKERFAEGSSLILTPSTLKQSRLEVRAARFGNKFITVKFSGVDERRSAEELVGSTLSIPADLKMELPDDRYWVDDLIGLAVIDAAKNPVGEVVEVRSTPFNDIYVVKSKDKEYLIPAVKEIVKRVDVEAGLIIIDPPIGLLE
ncbi:MAG: ribosome maturation factor RimM [Actinomycetota bacterium]|nr:ribosome maturation factor RimM [Actinomycetota bacterium]